MQGRWEAQVQLVAAEAGQEASAAPCCCWVSGVMPASAHGVACNAQGKGHRRMGHPWPCALAPALGGIALGMH